MHPGTPALGTLCENPNGRVFDSIPVVAYRRFKAATVAFQGSCGGRRRHVCTYGTVTIETRLSAIRRPLDRSIAFSQHDCPVVDRRDDDGIVNHGDSGGYSRPVLI